MAFIGNPLIQVLGAVAAILMGMPLLALSFYHVFSHANRRRDMWNRRLAAIAALLVFVIVPLLAGPVPGKLLPLMLYEAVKFLVWTAMVSFLVMVRGWRHFLISLGWSSGVGALLVAASYPLLDLLSLGRFHTLAAVVLAASVFLVVPFFVRTEKAVNVKVPAGRGEGKPAEKGSQAG